MPENIQITMATMPAFEALVPETIHKEATISLGILEEGIPSGVICLYYNDFHYTLTWIFVDEDKRRRGLGSALLEGATRMLREIEEVYPLNVTFTTEDEELLGFFQAYEHFFVRRTASIYSIPADKRRGSSFYQKMLNLPRCECRSFYDYEKKECDAFLEKVNNKSVKLADYLRRDMESFHPGLSLAYGRNDIRAAFFSKVSGNRIDMNVLFAEDLIALSMLLAAGVKRIEKDFPNYEVRVVCFKEQTEIFVRRFFEVKDMEFLLEADWDLRLPGEYQAFSVRT